MQDKFNSKDRDQWDKIFELPNPAWRKAPEQSFMNDALNFFRFSHARSVLDIGCGVGIWSIYLA